MKSLIKYKNNIVQYEDIKRYLVYISKKHNFHQGMKVVISISNPMCSLLTIMAAIYHGCEILLLSPLSKENTLNNINKLYSGWDLVFDGLSDEDYVKIKSTEYEDITFRGRKAFLHFQTSGTTGKSCKYVRLNFSDCLKKWMIIKKYIEIYPNDISLSVTSLYFIQTFWSVMLHMNKRSTIIFDELSSKLDQNYINKNGITTFTAPPSVIRGLLRNIELGRIRLFISGGDYLDKDTIEQIKVKCPNALLSNVYGCTETAAGDVILAPTPVDVGDNKIYSIGFPSCLSDVVLFNKNMKTCDINEIGEIYIKTKYGIKNYYGSNISVFENGYFPTRDIGYKNENGHIFYMGRLTNLIVSNGIKIHPIEIEECILGLKGIRECIVYGENDNKRGKIVATNIVRNDDNISEDTIVNYLSTKLESYKIPRKITFCNKLNKTSTGKIKR